MALISDIELPPLPELSDELPSLLRIELAEDLLVDHDDRSETAAAEAGNALKRDETIFRGLPPLIDSKLLLQGLCYADGTVDVARCPVAHLHNVLPERLEAELGVEGGNAVNPAERNSKIVCNFLQDFPREVAKALLRPLEKGGNERARLGWVRADVI